MRIAILGPLEVERDGAPADVAGGRLQALLARLALDAGRPVAPGALTDAVWDGSPPRDPQHALESLVSRLRRALGDPALVAGGPAGYSLAVDRDAVDVTAFERLARDGAAALRAGDAAGAAELLDRALALWRGAPAVDAARLEDLHLAARVDRLAAAAELGEAAARVAEVSELAARHPLDERLAALRIRALAAAGRQADALAAYEATRVALDEELGATPSAALQAAHLAVLRGDAEPVAAPPAAPSPPPRAGALPAPRTSFVGRAEDLGRVAQLLGEHRLVTLVGTGGAGKTRLAVEAAARAPWPAWLVELAPLGDADALAPALLSALGLREAQLPDRPHAPAPADVESRVVDALAATEALLVLDNCEHIVVPAAQLADRLLAACPGLRILATSREPLAIGGEALAPVGPLDEEAAVALFAQRAASASPSFALDDATTPVVADVCRRIDGLPLAIELAAARLRTMPLQTLADRLHDRFRLLTGGSRAAAGRQRTLRAVVDWSWDLLTEPERRLARRLSVLGSGASLEAAEAICAGDGVDRDEVFDLLSALVDRSLLVLADASGARWRMLETIREYAEEEAERAGELRRLREAHAAHFDALVHEADRHLRGPEQLPWLHRLRAERDEVVVALRFLGEERDGRALRLAIRLLWFWALNDGREEAERWLRFALDAGGDQDPLDCMLAEVILAITDPQGPPEPDPEQLAAVRRLLADADLTDRPLLAIAEPVIAMFAGDPERGEELLAALEGHHDPWVRAMAPFARAQMAENEGRLDEMEPLLDEALRRFRAAGDRWGTAAALSELGSLRMLRGDLGGADDALAETEALLDELGTGRRGGILLLRRAELLVRRGEHERALAMVADGLEDQRHGAERALLRGVHAVLLARTGDPEASRAERERLIADLREMGSGRPDHTHQRALGYGIVTRLEAEEGRVEDALAHAAEAYAAARSAEDMPISGRVAESLAVLALALGRPDDAAELLGAAMLLRGAEDRANPETAAVLERLEAELGPERLAAGLQAGHALGREGAIARLDPATLAPA